MRGFRSMVLLLPLLAAAVACSDDGDAAPASTTASPVVTAASTVVETTQPATTQPTTTAAAATTVPTTPAATAPPTTTPPTLAPGSVEEQVVAAALESWRLLNEALADPGNDDKVAVAGRTTTDPFRQAVIETIGDYRIKNWRLVANPGVQATATPYSGQTSVDEAANTAVVEYCEVNPWVLVQTAGNADGSDLVVDDAVSSQRMKITLRLEEAEWRVAEAELVENWSGATTCPDLS